MWLHEVDFWLVYSSAMATTAIWLLVIGIYFWITRRK